MISISISMISAASAQVVDGDFLRVFSVMDGSVGQHDKGSPEYIPTVLSRSTGTELTICLHCKCSRRL
jgi:hypothetical protein